MIQSIFLSKRSSSPTTIATILAGGNKKCKEKTGCQIIGPEKVRALPDETLVCCGHDYTLKNLEFAHHIEPNNSAVTTQLRKPPSMTTLAEEKKINPFLRSDDPKLQEVVGMQGVDPVAVFAHIRELKDRF